MQIESLESRTFMSAAPHTVTVPLKNSATGNLPAGHFEGNSTHLGKFTATIGANLRVVLTAANGDELWIQTLSLAPTSDPAVWRVEAQIVGGTGRFEGASGTGGHDLYFVDDQGNFTFSVDMQMTLRRPWNGNK